MAPQPLRRPLGRCGRRCPRPLHQRPASAPSPPTASTRLTARATRDSSPPEAIRASGRGGSPGLADSKNSTRSMPVSPRGPAAAVHRQAVLGLGVRSSCTTKRPGPICSPSSSADTARCSAAAASCAGSTAGRPTRPPPLPARRFPRRAHSVRVSPANSVSSSARSSSANASTSATVAPYLRFSSAMAARRRLDSSSAAGSASSCSA